MLTSSFGLHPPHTDQQREHTYSSGLLIGLEQLVQGTTRIPDHLEDKTNTMPPPNL